VASNNQLSPIILNGITDFATRPDLLDRGILVQLPVTEKSARRTERELAADLKAVRAGLLGFMLDALCAGLRRLPDVRDTLKKKPRMAVFA
jgi:hypothetical protein